LNTHQFEQKLLATSQLSIANHPLDRESLGINFLAIIARYGTISYSVHHTYQNHLKARSEHPRGLSGDLRFFSSETLS
jgi:hypothetical protein